MNFLAPIFLLGGLAIALPVIYHLIRRTTRERTLFSSLMFLQPTPPRLNRRSRLEHLLLLLLRCAALILLAAGFARPFFKNTTASLMTGGTSARIVILLDVSASMQRAGLWPEARSRAEKILRQTNPGDEVALFATGSQTRPVLSFAQWQAAPTGDRIALAVQKLGELAPGWTGSHLGNALVSAAEALADAHDNKNARARRVILISDFEEGNRLDQLQAFEWPKGVELAIENVKARSPNNAGLQWLTESDETTGNRDNVRVRVYNASDSRREQFKVGWANPSGSGFSTPPMDVYVPPGQNRVIAIPLDPRLSTIAPSLLLSGDEESFDNHLYVIPPETTHIPILYLGNDDPQDRHQPLYFIQRAFQETRRQAVKIILPAPASPLPAPSSVLHANYPLTLITSPLSPSQVQALRTQITNGHTALLMIKNTAMSSTLAGLAGVSDISLSEAPGGSYAMLTEIDFHHPLFAPFADPRFSDFTKIHFWKHRRMETSALPDARVLARFDDDTPALLELTLGRGHLFILLSGWHPEDSQLALSSKFVPLLYALLEQTGSLPNTLQSHEVGDTVPLTVSPNPSLAPSSVLHAPLPVKVQLPSGKELNLPPGTTNFSETSLPGIYVFTSGTQTQRMAFNLDAAESRTAPMSLDTLERLGLPALRSPIPTPADTQRLENLQDSELESRQKLWRWFILTGIVILLMESWLAGRAARQSLIPTEAKPL